MRALAAVSAGRIFLWAGSQPAWLSGCSAPVTVPLSFCRIGGEKVILLSACAWGFLTAATPLLAHLSGAHLVFMTFSRVLTGLLQGRAAS